MYNKEIYLNNYLDKFFYDICSQNYEEGKDLVINKRRKEYFQDPYKICIDNCNFNVPPDFIYKRAICNCQIPSPSHSLNDLYVDYYDNNIDKVMGEEFYDAGISVLESLKCFKYNFKDGNIFKNMGSYLTIFFFLFESITMIVYGAIGINSIKMFIIDFIKGNPPKKLKNIIEKDDSSTNNDIKSIISNKNISLNLMEEKNGNTKIKKKILDNNFKIKEIKIDNKKINSWESPDLLVGRSNNLGRFNKNKGIELYQKMAKIQFVNDNDFNEKESNKNKTDKSSNLFLSKKIQFDNNKNIIIKKYFHKFTDYELNSMELYDAVIKDKRL